jgi:hypothetical protein
MASATMDHMISLIVFIAAILIFIGFFSQNIQSAIGYESHKALSTKTSDLLDTMLLNPGIPANWGQSDCAVQGFGLQDPEFTQYQLSPFSLMRLSSGGNPVEYDKTSPNVYYNNVSSEMGSFLLTPTAQTLNYSTALALLGINNTYGFQLTFTPDIKVSVKENRDSSPLDLSVRATGTGFPLAGASINYCLMIVTLPQTDGVYPSYIMQNGVVNTDSQGIAPDLTFPSVTDPNQVYAFIAYAHLNGLIGVGYHTRDSSTDQYIVPIVQNLSSQEVVLAHNYDIGSSVHQPSSLKYNATFVIMKQDYTISELSLGSENPCLVGTVTSGIGNSYPSISLPTCTTGILIVTYQANDNKGGIVMMPWSLSSLAFPITFGGNPHGQSWVSTDIRQVIIGGIAYQAKLELWNQGMQVIG